MRRSWHEWCIDAKVSCPCFAIVGVELVKIDCQFPVANGLSAKPVSLLSLGLGFAKCEPRRACGLAGRAPNEGRMSTLSELDIIASGIPKTWACIDCGVNYVP